MLALLAPPRCLACGARAAPPWCPRCAAAAERYRTGAIDVGDLGAIEQASAAYRYEGPVRAALVTAKARDAWSGWPGLGRALAEADELPAADVVTWVPADARRVRQRGVDHARVLAAAVAQSVGLPLARFLVAAPRRVDQTALPPARRRRLDPSTFSPVASAAGARVLLVDDILTTGATARIAADALTAAGAGCVALAVLARAGRPRPVPSDPSRLRSVGATFDRGR